jgi:hypothetical protein
VTKNSLHFLVFLWQFFHKKFSLTHTLSRLVFITSNTLLIIFTSPALNKCSIKHKLWPLRDNLNVNSLRADKNESFLRPMEITVLVFFWRIIIVKRLYTERKKGKILLQIPFNYLKARLVFPTVSCQIYIYYLQFLKCSLQTCHRYQCQICFAMLATLAASQNWKTTDCLLCTLC